MSEQEMFDMIVELKTTIKEQALEIKHLKRELAEMDEAYKEADERKQEERWVMSEIKETESITLQIAYLRLYKHLSYRSIARIVGKSRNAVHHRFIQFAMNYNASEHYKNLAHTWFSKKVSQNEKSVPNA